MYPTLMLIIEEDTAYKNSQNHTVDEDHDQEPITEEKKENKKAIVVENKSCKTTTKFW